MAQPLPRLYLITPQPGPDDDAFLARLAASLDRLAAMPLVQLRAYGLAPARWRGLALRASALCHERGARLLLGAGALAASPGQAALGAWPVALAEAVREAGADGAHLPSALLLAASARPLPAGMLLAASCHDAAQLEQARRLGVDLVTVSPVLPTPSHPGAPTLGWQGLQRLCALGAAPVYALGGVGPRELPQALAAGAHGVAAIRALWVEPDAAGGDRAPAAGRSTGPSAGQAAED